MINKVYIAHYAPLVDRKERMKRDFCEKFQLEPVWVESEPTQAELQRIYKNNIQLWSEKISGLDYGGPIPHKILSESEKSIAYKHIEIWKDIAEKGVKTALILEDDVILDTDFPDQFNFNLINTPHDWDLIFIGSGCNLRIPEHRRQKGTIAYRKAHPASKCLDSYLIKHDAAVKLYNTISSFTMPIDFEINHHMRTHNMVIYWWDPPIVKQGSQCGLFDSEIIK